VPNASDDELTSNHNRSDLQPWPDGELGVENLVSIALGVGATEHDRVVVVLSGLADGLERSFDHPTEVGMHCGSLASGARPMGDPPAPESSRAQSEW
jgi:hypothetical protein